MIKGLRKRLEEIKKKWGTASQERALRKFEKELDVLFPILPHYKEIFK